MYHVTFRNVGRDKKCWDERLVNVDESTLRQAVLRSGALRSKGVDVVLAEHTGHITVGGFRIVGTLSWAPVDSHDVEVD